MLPLFSSSSASSCQAVPFEVADITDAEAVHYLVNTHRVPEGTAKELVATGGRFALLNKVADEIANKRIDQYICDMYLYTRTHATLINLKVKLENTCSKSLSKTSAVNGAMDVALLT
mgnify:CR=1 FL=1